MKRKDCVWYVTSHLCTLRQLGNVRLHNGKINRKGWPCNNLGTLNQKNKCWTGDREKVGFPAQRAKVTTHLKGDIEDIIKTNLWNGNLLRKKSFQNQLCLQFCTHILFSRHLWTLPHLRWDSINQLFTHLHSYSCFHLPLLYTFIVFFTI